MIKYKILALLLLLYVGVQGQGIKPSQLDPSVIDWVCSSCPDGQELAVHSGYFENDSIYLQVCNIGEDNNCISEAYEVSFEIEIPNQSTPYNCNLDPNFMTCVVNSLPEDQNDVTIVTGSGDAVVTSNTVDNVTTYNVDVNVDLPDPYNCATDPNFADCVTSLLPDDENDVTVVTTTGIATVTNSTTGNVTTYNVDVPAPDISCADIDDFEDCLPTQLTTTVTGGGDVTVTPTTTGNNTNYEVNVNIPNDVDTTTIIEGAGAIEVTSTTVGATNTFVIDLNCKSDDFINCVEDLIPEIPDPYDCATDPDFEDCVLDVLPDDENDVTVVTTSGNATVTSSTVGNTTTYNVNVPTPTISCADINDLEDCLPVDQNTTTTVQLENGTPLTISDVVSGNFINYTIGFDCESKAFSNCVNDVDVDSIYQLVAGSGITITENESGLTNTYTISAENQSISCTDIVDFEDCDKNTITTITSLGPLVVTDVVSGDFINYTISLDCESDEFKDCIEDFIPPVYNCATDPNFADCVVGALPADADSSYTIIAGDGITIQETETGLNNNYVVNADIQCNGCQSSTNEYLTYCDPANPNLTAEVIGGVSYEWSTNYPFFNALLQAGVDGSNASFSVDFTDFSGGQSVNINTTTGSQIVGSGILLYVDVTCESGCVERHVIRIDQKCNTLVEGIGDVGVVCDTVNGQVTCYVSHDVAPTKCSSNFGTQDTYTVCPGDQVNFTISAGTEIVGSVLEQLTQIDGPGFSGAGTLSTTINPDWVDLIMNSNNNPTTETYTVTIPAAPANAGGGQYFSPYGVWEIVQVDENDCEKRTLIEVVPCEELESFDCTDLESCDLPCPEISRGLHFVPWCDNEFVIGQPVIRGYGADGYRLIATNGFVFETIPPDGIANDYELTNISVINQIEIGLNAQSVTSAFLETTDVNGCVDTITYVLFENCDEVGITDVTATSTFSKVEVTQGENDAYVISFSELNCDSVNNCVKLLETSAAIQNIQLSAFSTSATWTAYNFLTTVDYNDADSRVQTGTSGYRVLEAGTYEIGWNACIGAPAGQRPTYKIGLQRNNTGEPYASDFIYIRNAVGINEGAASGSTQVKLNIGDRIQMVTKRIGQIQDPVTPVAAGSVRFYINRLY